MKKLKKALSIVLVLSMILGLTLTVNAGMSNTVSTGVKPTDGTTTGQPFVSGTGGSTNFRIPALATLSDGTLVAAADARWNQTGDGWGLDTIVSRSADDGASWRYTFANYLGDNENVYNSDSTAFIDPALAVTSDDTIYMLVDLYPHGTYIGNVKAGTGFDSNGHLLLRTSSGSSYDYYVGDFTNGKASIYQTNGTEVSGYTVDEYYNITGDECDTNLFFSDSPYQVLSTSYLYLTKSTDGGETWSAPQMLNSQVKDSDDMFYGVGPGRGLVTSTGRIIFPCYTYTTQDGNTSVIYSDDGGVTWTRSKDMSNQSSEAALVEADGNIYMFTRHGGYYVSKDNGATWGSRQSVSGISYTTTCQLSAITYSETINGQTAILLSAPTSGRTTGKIFVGLVQEDGSISWDYTYSVNDSGYYAYSCLTELSDGSVGLLYENASGSITYTNVAITDIASGAEIGNDGENTNICSDSETGVEVNFGSIEVKGITVKETEVADLAGKTYVAYDITPEGYKNAADVTIPLTGELQKSEKLTGFVVEEDGEIKQIIGTNNGDSYIFTAPHFSVMGVMALDDSGETSTETKDVTLYVGQSTTITDSTGNYESSYTGSGLDTGIAKADVKGTTVEGGTTKTLGSTVSMNSNGTYTGVISDGNGNYLVYTTKERSSSGTYEVSTTKDISEATEWTITRNSSNGSTTYAISYDGKRLTRNTSGTVYTSDSSSSTWRYSGTDGFYYSNNNTNKYLVYDNGWSIKETSGSKSFLYSVTTTTTDPVDATTITFTGVAEGTTSVVVGNTKYNITVKEAPDYVDLSTTPFTSGTGQYSGQKVTKLTTSVNVSYDLNLSISGSSIVWSSADESIAKVDQNGTITGVSAGETTVTCTVDEVAYIIPVVVVSDSYGGSYDYTCDIRISEITSTTVRYSLNLSTNLLDAQEGEAIYLGYNYPFCINFFGVEDEGYALTYMASTNSAGNYYSLYEVSALSDLAAYNGGAIKNQYNSAGFNTSDVDTMLWYAINNGYHGTMGWTRTTTYTGSSIYSDLTFRSEKLPTVEKTIKTVNGTAYTEGMTAKAGDEIVYDVTVTQYATTEAITYSNVTLKDNLSGATFSTNNSATVSPSLSNNTLTANKTYSYTVTYTITNDDLDTDIINTVDLSYSYSGQYSEGNYGGEAKAEAKISAPSFTPDDIVIDFGLPVVIDYSQNHGRYDIVRGTATYGTVTVEDNKVTYTPNTVLQGVDTVTLTNTKNSTVTFKVYPATTVYYEEGFAELTGWTGGSKGSGTQATQIAGASTDEYGYDSKYAEEKTGESNGTEAVSSTIGDDAVFTFTGTGVDIYANCTTETGAISIMVKDSNNAIVKILQIDTSTGIAGNATTGQDVTSFSLPVASVSGLTHGTYTVTIRHSKSSAEDSGVAVKLDGFRVYGTLENSGNTVYTADKEDDPVFIELRDKVLKALTVDTENSKYADDIAEDVYAQVYATTQSTEGAIVISNNTSYFGKDVQDLLDNGPKNELFLRQNESVVFKVTTDREVQIGLKAATGTAKYTIADNGSVSEEKELTSSTDMFYTVVNASDSKEEHVITITNKGSGILSITKVKICDDPAAALGALTEEDLAVALAAMGYGEDSADPSEPEEPEVTYADAALTVQVNNTSTVLTKNGIVDETATFTAAEIEEAAESLVADGYTLQGTVYTDVDVSYGKSDTVMFIASENAVEQEPANIIIQVVNSVKNFFEKIFGRR